MLNQPSLSNQGLRMKKRYEDLNDQSWKLVLNDSGAGDWSEHWVLDGKECVISNSADGLEFKSGLEAGNNAHHGVLWSKQSFAGDMKVSFEFTRLDTINRYVNILYFHAHGIGEGEYDKDIHKWSHLREIPYMKTYFENMDMLHISFAAFGNKDDEPEDYIRVRRYPVRADRDFNQMEVDGTIFGTGLFLPNITYQVSFIKTLKELVMEIQGGNETLYHHWDISKVDPTFDGPFGIRQMWQKHSVYKNIKIYTL